MIYYGLKQVSGLPSNRTTLVAEAIGRQIVSSHFAPHTLMEEESTLAVQHGVSRSVIRDAIKILVGKGLLEVRRGIGTRVRSRSSWGLLDNDVMAWSQSSPLNAKSLRQLMQLRRIVEPAAARLTAEQGSDEKIHSIAEAINRMEAERGSAEEFIVADAEFHRAVLRGTENEFLIILEGVTFSVLLDSIRITNCDPRENSASILLHRKVYEAIARRDGAHAEMIMQKLLDDTSHRLDGRLNSA